MTGLYVVSDDFVSPFSKVYKKRNACSSFVEDKIQFCVLDCLFYVFSEIVWFYNHLFYIPPLKYLTDQEATAKRPVIHFRNTTNFSDSKIQQLSQTIMDKIFREKYTSSFFNAVCVCERS